MSIYRNHARLDIQLYLDIPDDVLNQFNKTGYKPTAIDVLNELVAEETNPHEIVQIVSKYIFEVRTKVSGGNAQLARDTHLRG